MSLKALLKIVLIFLLLNKIQTININDMLRIRYGRNVNIKEFPFMVKVFYKENNYLKLCSGTVISNICVLTAAHCLQNSKVKDVRAVSIKSDNKRKKIHYALKVKIYPNYNPKYQSGDIAIIVINDTFHQNEVERVQLNINDIEPREGTTLGWGHTAVDEAKTKSLRAVSTNIKTRKKCAKHFRDGTDYLCAVPNIARADVGDSGGPIITPEGEQIGVTSFALSDNPNPKTPTSVIYARLGSPAIAKFLKRKISKSCALKI